MLFQIQKVLKVYNAFSDKSVSLLSQPLPSPAAATIPDPLCILLDTVSACSASADMWFVFFSFIHK